VLKGEGSSQEPGGKRENEYSWELLPEQKGGKSAHVLQAWDTNDQRGYKSVRDRWGGRKISRRKQSRVLSINKGGSWWKRGFFRGKLSQREEKSRKRKGMHSKLIRKQLGGPSE